MNQYVNILDREFKKRSSRNPNYSLRAYARDLSINSGTLSSILKEERTLPMEKAKFIAKELHLSLDEERDFLNSLFLHKLNLKSIIDADRVDPKRTLVLEEDTSEKNRILEEWEFYAILNLIEVDHYTLDSICDIQKRLALASEEKTREMIGVLMKHLYITLDDDGKLCRHWPKLKTKDDVSSQVIQNSHLNVLDLAKEHLKDDVSEREYRAITFKSSRRRIKEAKKLIREFSLTLTDFLSDSELAKNEDVFQLNIQFFPITESK